MLANVMACLVAGGTDVPVFAHYMPWFETPESNLEAPGQWGYHWTLQNRNPNIILPNGQRDIASHFYPLIEPYASSDPDVIEYHLLLMKTAGIDGIIIDWYGVQGTNGDIGGLLRNSDAIANQIHNYGLEFAVMLEDRFSANIQDAVANVAYCRDNYFNLTSYARDDQTNEPWFFNFGPITFEFPSAWNQILSAAGEPVQFLPLQYQSGEVGTNGDGEFYWPTEEEALNNHLTLLNIFYNNRAPSLNRAVGAVYPSFIDFYEEGGVGDIIGFEIPYANGGTLEDTINAALANEDKIEMVQLTTWNDFGEGTIFEPTVERGFQDLIALQRLTGSTAPPSAYQSIFRLFQNRKRAGEACNPVVALSQLQNIANQLNLGSYVTAEFLLDLWDEDYECCAGDLDGNGSVDFPDLLTVLGAFGTTNPEADANGDGAVEFADILFLLARWGAC